MDDLAAALDESRGGRGTFPYIEALDLGTIAASTLLYGAELDLFGWVITESSGGGVAKVRLRDGRGVDGSVVAPIALAASGTSIMIPAYPGIRLRSGLYLERVSGSVEVVVYYRAP